MPIIVADGGSCGQNLKSLGKMQEDVTKLKDILDFGEETPAPN